jgi:hypothetical protein
MNALQEVPTSRHDAPMARITPNFENGTVWTAPVGPGRTSAAPRPRIRR